MSVEFRRASVEDTQKLIDVQNKSFYDDFIKHGGCLAYNEPLETMESLIQNAIVYKILKNNEIIGDIIVRRRDNNVYYLRVISVIPEFQNMGIGQKAIKHIESDNSDAVLWELITSPDSYRNHHFYEKMGYVKADEDVYIETLSYFLYKKLCRTDY